MAAAAARAQEQTPGFSVPQIITQGEFDDLTIDFDQAFGSIENPFLSDTMKLNYQISLLEKLVARQTELDKIRESYEAMGLRFNEPAPSRGLCMQLPVNAICLKHYPDLYTQLISERKAYYDEIARKARLARAMAAGVDVAELPPEEGDVTDEEAIRRAEKAEAERKAKAAALERRTRYQWTEVTCLAGQCHGVMVSERMPGFRTTVRPGSKLDDGTRVQSVSRSGITVVIAGDTIALRPAPNETNAAEQANSGAIDALLSGGGDVSIGPSGLEGPQMATPSAATSAASSAAAAVIAGADSTTAAGPPTPPVPVAPAAGASGASASAGGQTVAEPALGASGLF